jgi:hypothetical protein
MSQDTKKKLGAVIGELRRLLVILERATCRDTAIDQQILDLLKEIDGASTNGLAKLIRRRRGHVLRTVTLLHEAGRVEKVPGQNIWRLRDGAA